jgi:photosystem II stability/assembly factor-like uncharacterized protein
MTDTTWYPLSSAAGAPAPRTDTPGLVVTTRKGLWRLAGAGDSWWATEPAFLGHIVQHALVDPRDGTTLLAGASTGHLGPTVFRSPDRGATWTEAARPPAFPAGEPLARAVRSVFWLTPGHESEPGVWYAGGSPQGLFRTEDAGDTWEPVSGWNDHPHWTEWAEWPEENTPDGSLLHSVIVDPRDPAHLYLGMSSGGVFESTDRGGDWRPLNDGLATVFDPEPGPPFSHDPHCVRMHPGAPDRLYQQNHCGIYRLDRPGETWDRIGDHMPREVGDIGFSIELHPDDPDTAWVFPMDGTEVWPRTSPDGRPAVYVTRDAGASWTRQDAGLPERGWLTTKRQATTIGGAPPCVFFGTTGGEVWAGANGGESWDRIVGHLPEIYSLEYAAAVV